MPLATCLAMFERIPSNPSLTFYHWRDLGLGYWKWRRPKTL